MAEKERASGGSDWLCKFTQESPDHGGFLALGKKTDALNLRYGMCN